MALTLQALRASSRRNRYIIPYLFTFSNALLGLCAVILALEDTIYGAAYCIIVAAIMDMLDGRLARALGVSSSLGMELDSLSDAVSFCVAPAVLLYSACLSHAQIVSIIGLSCYLCAGLFRLAKFNLTHSIQQRMFVGLPTPIAAIFFAALVLNAPSLMHYAFASAFMCQSGLALLLIGIAYLMISSIRFATFKQCSKRQVYSLILFLFFVGIFSLLYGLMVPFAVIIFYLVSNVMLHVANSWPF